MTTTLPFGLRQRARPLALGLAAGLLGLAPLAAQAQLTLSSAAPKTENFDGIGSSATASLPAGFKFSGEATPTYNSSANYTATTVAANGNNFTAGGTYNFGTAATATDRAVGFLNSGSYTTPRHVLLALSNTSGSTIQDLTVQFNLEKYRSGSREYNWTFYTSPDGVTWTAQPAGAQNYPADANNTVYSYPPLSTAKSVVLSGVNLASGATYYLRWTQQGVGGSTNGQGSGLDDVTLTPTLAGSTTTPPPVAATISTGSVSPTAFCVTSAAGSTAFSVPFTSTGILSGTYRVQLSDASGAFAGTPGTIIGSGSASPLSAVIPAGTASGTGYRVRVLNDNPATTGTDNGADLTVSLTPASNPVTVSPGVVQSVSTTGTGALLTAAATLSGSTYAFQYSASAGGPYASSLATGSTYQVRGADFPGAGTYYVVAQATATTSCGSVVGTSDPVAVTVTAPAAAPVVTVSDATLPDFGSVAVGAGSLLKSFTVSGTGLTGNLTITPAAGFEIRTSGGAFACCAITLPASGGSVPTTTVEVRFVPTASQAYQAAITVAGGGQPAQIVAVAGTGAAAVYPATLSTASATNLAATTATLGGTIADDGGSAVTARGVVYGRAANPTIALATKTADGSGNGTFSSALTGLVPGTTYFARAYATNGVGTTYGNELTFTAVGVALATEPASPATVAAGTITGTSIQLLLGGGPSQKYLVLAHLGAAVDAAPTDATTYTANAAFGSGQAVGTGNYVVYSGPGPQVTVTGLRPNSPYYFSVFAYNDNNTPYAENYLTTSPGTLAQTTTTAPAALLLEENFDYPAGSLLTANNWTAHSGAGTNPVTVVAANLTLPGYGPNSGNAAALTASGEDVSRQFAPVYARTPTYAAFLVKVNSASATADYFFHLGPQALGSTFRARVFVRSAGAGKVQFGISGGTGTAGYTSGSYNLGTTYLLVVKYVFDEAGNTSQLFINPSTDTEPATADATQTETGTTPAAPNDNIGTVALRQGTNSPNLVLDGLRVGTSFRVVKTGLAAPAPAAVSVLYANGGSDPADSDVSPFLQLVNQSAAAIPYQELTVRYYLTVENFAPVVAAIGYAELGTSGVQARYVALPQPAQGALGYIEYSFSSPLALAAGANSGQILSHIHKQNYSALDETDDYSYATNTAYAPNDRITVYRNGVLVSGTEPAALPAAAAQLRALSANQTTSDASSTLDVVAQVDNLGTSAIPYSDLTARYWFTPDGASPVQGSVGYAQLGSDNVSLSFGQAGTQPYAELHFAAGLGSLAPRSGTGQIIFHLHKADWSAFSQANDYSFRASQELAENAHITVYQQGQLVYGQEPAGAQSSLTSARAGQAATSGTAATDGSSDPLLDQSAVFEAYPNPFSTRSQLHFRPAGSGPVRLVVYNTLGQVVHTLFDGAAQAGQDYSFTLDANRLSYGLYLAQLKMDGQTRTIRLVIAR